MSSQNPNNLIDVFYNENYIEETQNIELKRTIITVIKEFNKFKEHTKKQLKEHREDRDKFLTEVKENTNTWLYKSKALRLLFLQSLEC